MRFKTLLFDLDGTIVNSLPLIKASFKYVFDKFDLPWNNGEVLKTIGLPLQGVAEQYLPGRAEEFLSAYVDYQRRHQEELLHAYPGTVETISALKEAGYPLGVVTSKRRPATEDSLRLTGLDQFFSVVVTVEDSPRPKPNPDPVLKALDLFGIGKEEAVFIGDSWYDILTGKNAGVTTIAVTWGMASSEELNPHFPDFIVNNWAELIMTLRGLC